MEYQNLDEHGVPPTQEYQANPHQNVPQYIPQYQPPPQYQQQNTQQYQQPSVYVPTYQPTASKVSQGDMNDSSTSILYFALGFICFCIWIAGYCRFKNSTDSSAKTFAVLSLVFFIISLLVLLVCMGFIIFYFVIFIILINGDWD
ncbi:hypothetical protein EIN_143900 [Entamoeba invadens IP1]|uniref:Uncharacterized protein n=1 Tax=Entamoeba invadens IP1 TaxID=370355 RepID=A0A0A1U960_ENTIV|nr:hypothetical protein EIN_143900 [Entamoeba invadens IP1]ELP91480.1 hypothetical protein EIN_143900 [Entamoeba invadens IP1]|eukprot:XP_004258251.1 hypothetical protein EIN_143900 [Entamoeba invadens IP1]